MFFCPLPPRRKKKRHETSVKFEKERNRVHIPLKEPGPLRLARLDEACSGEIGVVGFLATTPKMKEEKCKVRERKKEVEYRYL